MISLICDDDPVWRRALARILDGSVIQAEDLGSALTMIETAKPNVLLLDSQLPDGVGWQAIPAFHARSPHTEIVVMTALPRRTDGLRSIGEHHAFAYLDKADGMDVIRKTVRKAFMSSLFAAVKARFSPVGLGSTSAPVLTLHRRRHVS